MKKTFIFSFLVLLFISFSGFRTKNPVYQNMLLQDPVKVDGRLLEWTDSLSQFNADAKLSYLAANNDSVFYLAVKTSDPHTIRKILTFGFSFGINKEGKKKPEIILTFPYIEPQRGTAAKPPTSTRPDFSKINQIQLAKAKGIIVNGLKGIIDGKIALKNEYGIDAAATIDSNNVFRYELSVPLHYLALDPTFKGELAYNFKINGLERTVLERGAGASRRYGYGGYGYPYDPYGYNNDVYQRKITDAVEFWEKFKLAGVK